MARHIPLPGARIAGSGPSGLEDDPISLGLRKLWAEVEREEVPDDFLDLLDQIDERRAASPDEQRPQPAARKGRVQ
ncbi:hypothetical protein FJQ54_03755 [Sandaracinobacter neustonicus]|uniref:Anti-sigma factor NepR domain-containing protein n=1 Tax=Sandaracinobacter neustonicus TaxID=1715348 RepID=A0A501XUE1_9SPHN|nr:NepR family anti-sigma factor [Sandaracinobacter neustonicus]TPE63963.1 hypothetical protein FJQ54_03755 [Sandaracinobacter neustonicus]